METICNKVKFANEKFALMDIKRITTKKEKRKSTPIRVYKCKCGSWHLTSQEDKFKIIKKDLVD